MNAVKFDKEYITGIKKNIINYISKTSVSVNKITFNLSLYTNFVISEDDDTTIKVTLPEINEKKVIPAKIEIGSYYFDIKDNEYYIKPKVEETLLNRLTKILVKGASLRIAYENMTPIAVEGVGLVYDGDGYDSALNEVIAEEINNYVPPFYDDPYAFNKGIIKMIIALTGKKYTINSYFNHDKSLFMALYSLSVDSNLFIKINKELTLIKHLISTVNSKEAIYDKTGKEIIDKLIYTKKADLLNFIINKLYIPYVNSVYVDKRKAVRDEILKGFLGNNYTNLKLDNDNKDSYYWASVIKNTVPINNKVTDQAWTYFRGVAVEENENNMHEIYAMYTKAKSKNNVKEFMINIVNDKVSVDTGKKVITEKNLVNEILSYAYISSIDDVMKEKLEKGIVQLCSSKDVFTSTLKGNPLSNRMLTAAIIQLADKNGYKIELLGIDDGKAMFKVKETP